tara:strand:+ start:879 stop:1931 length:1053 start_codon:yes stop_codon:yes gene_type:complete
MNRVPSSLTGFDADWIGNCLAQLYPGTRLTGLRRGQVINGTATKVEYFLEYNDVGQSFGLPSSLWLKCGVDAAMPEQVAHSAIEANFFRDIAPRLSINIPKPFGTVIEKDQSSGVVLYEDLNQRPVEFGNQDSIISPQDMLATLDLLADFHASFWKADALGDFDWLLPGGTIGNDGVIDQFLGFWDYANARPRFAEVPQELRNLDRYSKAVHKLMRDDMAKPICLVHGDPHVGNQFRDADGTPGLLDWATVMQGHWAWDVSYAIISSQPVEQRRAHEREQLGHYLSKLVEKGIAVPNMEDAWRDYARHAAWNFMFALCPTELQPEEMCVRNARRASAAMTDLDTLQLLLN